MRRRKPKPTLALVMIVRDAEATIAATLQSVRDSIGHWTICDTGSTDHTAAVIHAELAGIPGRLHRDRWQDFGHNRTRALEHARGTARWLLMLDSDERVEELHPDLLDWLAGDPEPDVDAWNVTVVEDWGSYRVPYLTRGDRKVSYSGATHEWLNVEVSKTRDLLGLTVRHTPAAGPRTAKYIRDLQLLRPGYEAGDPRATFYYAQTLRGLELPDDAVAAYKRRAAMTNGWDEERWYAAYQAADLAGDIDGLLAAHRARPWRHEPLQAAARIVKAAGAHNDRLFLEH